MYSGLNQRKLIINHDLIKLEFQKGETMEVGRIDGSRKC